MLNYVHVVLDGKIEVVDLVEVDQEQQNTVIIKEKIYEVRVVRLIGKGDWFGFYGTFYEVPEQY